MITRTLSRTVLALAAAISLACGGGSGTPTTPTPPPPPPVAQISGNWSGTFETSTYATVPILVTLNQTAATISGTWATSGTTREAGTISGTVDSTSFVGTVTFSFNQGPTCQGAFSGTASTSTLNWSSPGFTGNCGLASPGNPLNVRFVLQRR